MTYLVDHCLKRKEEYSENKTIYKERKGDAHKINNNP